MLTLIVHFTCRDVHEQLGELTLTHKKMEAQLLDREAAVFKCACYTVKYTLV